MALPGLYLASQSPRRRQILENMGLPFNVRLPNAEEAIPSGASPDDVIVANAHAKAASVVGSVGPKDIVLGADTLVILDGEVMGKPSTSDDGRRMLQKLSGRTHDVVTGISLLTAENRAWEKAVRSRVTFRHLSENEITQYLGTSEPYDKAGAYAVQGLGAIYIDRIDGSYTNVMGLPVEEFLKGLGEISDIPLYDWF